MKNDENQSDFDAFLYPVKDFNAQSPFVKACTVMIILALVLGVSTIPMTKGSSLEDSLTSACVILLFFGGLGMVYAYQNYQWVIGGDYICPSCHKIEGKVIEKVDVLESTSTDVNKKVDNNIKDKDGKVVGTVEQMVQMKFIMATEKWYCKCNGCGIQWDEEVKRNYYE